MTFTVIKPTPVPGYPGKSDAAHGSFLSGGGFLDAGGEKVDFNVMLTTGTKTTPPWTPDELNVMIAALQGGASGASWDGKPFSDADRKLAAENLDIHSSVPGSISYAGVGGRVEMTQEALFRLRAGGVSASTADTPSAALPSEQEVPPYESEHKYSKAMTKSDGTPYRGRFFKAAYSGETHINGVNEVRAELERLGWLTPEIDAMIKVSRSGGIAVYDARTKPLYLARRDADPTDVVTEAAAMAALGGIGQKDANAAYEAFDEIQKAIFVAHFPRTLDGLQSFSRTHLYACSWYGRRGAADHFQLVGLGGNALEFDPFTKFIDQDPLRHLVVGQGQGGLHVNG